MAHSQKQSHFIFCVELAYLCLPGGLQWNEDQPEPETQQ